MESLKDIDKQSKDFICLIGPNGSGGGGVGDYLNNIKKFSKKRIIFHELKSVGEKSLIKKLYYQISSYPTFLWILITKPIYLVHINPSLFLNSLVRDGFFAVLAKGFKKKIFIQWHGWKPENENLLTLNRFLFNITLGKADQINVLIPTIAPFIRGLGFKKRIAISKTFVSDDEFIDLKNSRSGKIRTILFLATISKNKGIYEAINIFQRLCDRYSFLKLIIAGDGPELKRLQIRLPIELVDKVEFTGYVSGGKKLQVFRKSDCYIFPSYYEGMPISVLEAMGQGLPIVCSNVGALPDFFENGKMGFMIEGLNLSDYVDKIDYLISNPEKVKVISNYNIGYIRKNHLASKCVKELDTLYSKMLSH
jgi:glycosyltransferase involved in cell wall biosynthesis